jgi:hypothetical protein
MTGKAALYAYCPPQKIPKSSSKTQNKSRKNHSRSLVRLNKPPQIRSNIIYNHTFRFAATAGATAQVTVLDALGAAGGICFVVNSQLALFAQSVKINSVSIWSPPPSQGAVSTCSVEWASTAAQSIGYGNQETSDTSNSVASPAVVFTRPPRNSLASFWQSAASTVLFTCVTPAGSIVDFSASFILCDVNTPEDQGVAVAALGSIYYLALDGPTTNNLVPVSMVTTH